MFGKSNSSAPTIRRETTAYAYLAPAAIVLAVFWILPVILSLFVSFTNWHGGDTLGDVKWVGLENYRMAMRDPRFFKTLWNTVNYVIWSVPLTIALSLGVALLMNMPLRFVGFFRTVFFLPYITTWVAISIVWSYFFHKNFGLANWVLQEVFGAEPLMWLDESRGVIEMALTGLGHLTRLLPADAALDFQNPLLEGPSLALFSIIITTVWREIGYFMIIFLAGLMGIDRSYHEAAMIDGAGPWRRFWTITFPLLSPVTFFVFIVAVIGAFKIFVPILIMTPEGGPSRSTATIVYALYEEGFLSWRLGYASAIAYILFVIILIFTVIQNAFIGRKVHYE